MKTTERGADKRLTIAREAFNHLLQRETKVGEWKQLFEDYPDVLSSSVPLALRPDRLVPSRSRKRPKPAWVFYAHRGEGVPRYGVLELTEHVEEPSSPASEQSALLMDDVFVAAPYCEASGLRIRHTNRHVLCVGNRSYLFFIVELRQEVCDLLGAEVSKEGALPNGLQLLVPTELRALFDAKVAPQIMLLASTRASDMEKDARSVIDILKAGGDEDFKSSMCG